MNNKNNLGKVIVLSIATMFIGVSILSISAEKTNIINKNIESAYLCGDINGNGAGPDIADLVYLVDYMFQGGPAPVPNEYVADVDMSGEVNIADLVYLVSYMFQGGPAPCSSPSGRIIDYGGCKDFTTKDDPGDDPFYDCIEYQYDGGSTLLLTHFNSGFNCCPLELLADITISNNVITIVEDETFEFEPCPCLCLFDVYYEIINLPVGEYTIRIDGLNVYPEEIMEFTIDLSTEPSGQFCVYRDYYPWGEPW